GQERPPPSCATWIRLIPAPAEPRPTTSAFFASSAPMCLTPGRAGKSATALWRPTEPLFCVFGQQIAQRNVAAPGLGRKPLGKVTRNDDGTPHAIVPLPALITHFRHARSSSMPELSRHRQPHNGEECGRSAGRGS